jgi:hypothetical protein
VGGIYLRQGESFTAMHEQPYEAESVLQALIAEHPEVLAGDDEQNPRSWLLVKREAGVADRPDGAERWSLDHLFLDQEGIPTLVEVKRSSDTRARREVVAQLLDYAANASAHWTVGSVRAWFEAECEARGADPERELERAFAAHDPESYWDTVRTNLAAEHIRLVFVADEISPELRIIVEFLNRHMAETEVLAVEVKQYVDAAGERQTIVPRLLGQTEAARAIKSAGTRAGRQWDERSLLEELVNRHGDEVAAIARSVMDWAKDRDDVRIGYGRGAKDGSAMIRLENKHVSLAAFNLWSYNAVEIPFDFMRAFDQAPFADRRESRDQLRQRINEAVPGAHIPPEGQRPRPSFELDALADEPSRLGFLAAIQWAV